MTGWKDIVYIAVGSSNIYGVTKDGKLLAAGSNNYGQCDVEKFTNIAQK